VAACRGISSYALIFILIIANQAEREVTLGICPPDTAKRKREKGKGKTQAYLQGNIEVRDRVTHIKVWW